MVLVCDREVSDRAIACRERMRERGIPAAASALSSIRDCLPARFFVTFTDVFDDLRRLPFGEIFCVAVGEGFVNSALNAVRVPDPESAADEVWDRLPALLGNRVAARSSFGIHLTPEIFRGAGFYEIRGHTVVFTPSEERVFLYLLAATDAGHCAPPAVIRAYCASGEASSDDANAASALVCAVNRKLEEVSDGRAFREKRLAGYYRGGI